MNRKIDKKQFILYNNLNPNNSNNKNNSDLFIFKPILLLKFWDNTTEDNYIQSYQELNKFFLIKTYLKTKDFIQAYEELNSMIEDESLYANSYLFLFYFGKVIACLIEKIDKISDKKILDFLNKDKIESYNKIKRILREFGQPNSFNFKKKAKNYENLAKISEYFKIDPKK